MTISTSLMYWFTRLDIINIMCGIVTFLGFFIIGIATIIYCVASADTYSDEAPIVTKLCKRFVKILIVPWIVALLGVIFVPTSKEMAMIYVVPHIAESQVIKQDVPELYDLGINALKDWLKKEQPKGEQK